MKQGVKDVLLVLVIGCAAMTAGAIGGVPMGDHIKNQAATLCVDDDGYKDITQGTMWNAGVYKVTCQNGAIYSIID